MNNLNTFLTNTELSAKDTIIISVVSSLAACFLIFLLACLFKPIINRTNTYIENKFGTIVKYIKIQIRHAKGKVSASEYIQLEKKIKEGKPLTRKEVKLYNIAKEQYKIPPETAEKLKEAMASLRNFNFPRIPRI